jgi:hypothetical protein
MVHGHDVWMSLTIVILHPDQCFGCFFAQKEGIFWEKNVFLVESLDLFF